MVIKKFAYQELVKKYKEVDAMASRETVTQKINCLRSVFKKDLIKEKSRNSLELGGGEVYKPSLWYFDSLHFLNDQDVPRCLQKLVNDESVSVDMEYVGERTVSKYRCPLSLYMLLSTPAIDNMIQRSIASNCASRQIRLLSL